MNLTAAIYRHGPFFFSLLLLMALLGFWVSYFARLGHDTVFLEHLHGLAMFGWCLLLIAQSTLIRRGRKSLHRFLGRVSYFWVPLIAFSTLWLASYKLSGRGLSAEGTFLLAIQIFLLIQLLWFYGLAISNRKMPARHARYMLCTALPLIDPILARILFVGLSSVVENLTAYLQLISFGFTDLLVVALLWLEGDSELKKIWQFALVILLLTQLPVLLLGYLEPWQIAWRSVAQLFLGWPTH